MMPDARQRAMQSLRALSIGDAFGELFFRTSPKALVGLESMPAAPWRWTDDAHMAISVVETLFEHGFVEQASLAHRFAARFAEEPWRGYAGGAVQLLTAVAEGGDWQELAGGLFGGTGSYGNGAAMRVAPVGAYFADDLSRARSEAERSAVVTHAHDEAVAGAVAVAISAALRWSSERPQGQELIHEVAAHTPDTRTRKGLLAAIEIGPQEFHRAASVLGTGDDVAVWDTVPFCVWMAAHHAADFAFAIRATVGGMGDRDTTCAIVAGILAPDPVAIPEEWERATEALPDELGEQGK